MISEFLASLSQCRTRAEFWRVHNKAENVFTPSLIALLDSRRSYLPPDTVDWLDNILHMGDFGNHNLENFRWQAIHPEINLYYDPSIARNGKILVLGFCGINWRLMIPTPCILQTISSRLFDVVLICDRNHTYFNLGPDSSLSLLQLCQQLARILRASEYRDVYTYGVSNAGLPALQAGTLLHSRRAISICPRLPSPARRITKGSQALPAFDPLCECVESGTKLICVYGSDNRRDAAAAWKLAKFRPMSLIAVPNVGDHNVIFELAKLGQLPRFHDYILGEEFSPNEQPEPAILQWSSPT
jgi:hypothetical protein